MLTITDIISSNWNQNVTVILTKCRLRRGRGDAKSRQLEWYHVQSAEGGLYTAPLYRDEWTKQMRHQFWWRPATLAARIGQPLPGMYKILFKNYVRPRLSVFDSIFLLNAQRIEQNNIRKAEKTPPDILVSNPTPGEAGECRRCRPISSNIIMF